MQQKALYKFFLFSLFLVLLGVFLFRFVLFFNFVGFNFSSLWGEIDGFPFFVYFIELEVLWKGRTLSMNCNYTAAVVQSHFMCLLPLKMWINRLQNYQTVLDRELFLSPFPTCKCLLAVLLWYYFVSEGDTSACR